MIPEIPISVIKFIYEAIDPVTIPAYSGTLWHSVFGRALRELNCIAPDFDCKQCMLLHQCDYPYLFRRWGPPESEMMRGKEIPVPHIFRFDHTEEQLIESGAEFAVSLVLAGSASEKIPVIIRAMFSAGMAGLGKNRSRARLQNVSQTGPNSVPITILEQDRILEHAQPKYLNNPNPPQTANITFITPYKPSGNNHPYEINISHFLMAIVRRISLMQYFYTDKRLEADFQHLKTLTETVNVIRTDAEWIRPERPYFAKHGQDVDISGWSGLFEIQIESIQELWPYLFLGQWLGVGKKASMGFGRYGIIDPSTGLNSRGG